MPLRAINPDELKAAAEELKMSAAIQSGNHLFLTGATGGNADGTMPLDPETQFRNVFRKIGQVLAAGGLGFDAIAEMTSYHIDIKRHFDVFDKVRLDHVSSSYPAWTAVEVAGLRRDGALVEVRVIAATDA